MNTLWRLAWALPLVLAVGGVMMLVLKRFVAPAQPAGNVQRMSKRESLPLSDDTHVHLIEVDGKSYLIVESARNTVLQASLPQTNEARRSPIGFGPRWLQHLNKARS